MNIRKLYNPRTPSYNNFKKKVLGGQFRWEYLPDTLNFGKDEDVISTIECLTPEQKRDVQKY